MRACGRSYVHVYEYAMCVLCMYECTLYSVQYTLFACVLTLFVVLLLFLNSIFHRVFSFMCVECIYSYIGPRSFSKPYENQIHGLAKPKLRLPITTTATTSPQILNTIFLPFPIDDYFNYYQALN